MKAKRRSLSTSLLIGIDEGEAGGVGSTVRRTHLWRAMCGLLLASYGIAASVGIRAAVADQGAPERPLVGVYYYPWYRASRDPRPARGNWSRALRVRLTPPQEPALGFYDSAASTTIKTHLTQSRRAGIDFWAVSWWGPGSRTDRVFRNSILGHAEASQLRYAIIYESTGRMGRMSEPRYDCWLSDLEYLQENLFNHPRYLRIDGRPVLFFYLARVYFSQPEGMRALRAMRERFPGIYLIADDVFGPNYPARRARLFDAVTAYDVYGQSLKPEGATRAAIERLAANYRQAKQAANSVGSAFVPAVSPGYNDRVVRAGNPARGRYFTDERKSIEGDVFRAMIRDVALPNLDERASRMFMITSFNEWYEDTQIEPTRGTQPNTSRDDSAEKRALTEGQRYSDYGELYLNLLRDGVESPTSADETLGGDRALSKTTHEQKQVTP